jgi:hypothetical protein
MRTQVVSASYQNDHNGTITLISLPYIYCNVGCSIFYNEVQIRQEQGDYRSVVKIVQNTYTFERQPYFLFVVLFCVYFILLTFLLLVVPTKRNTRNTATIFAIVITHKSKKRARKKG